MKKGSGQIDTRDSRGELSCLVTLDDGRQRKALEAHADRPCGRHAGHRVAKPAERLPAMDLGTVRKIILLVPIRINLRFVPDILNGDGGVRHPDDLLLSRQEGVDVVEGCAGGSQQRIARRGVSGRGDQGLIWTAFICKCNRTGRVPCAPERICRLEWAAREMVREVGEDIAVW